MLRGQHIHLHNCYSFISCSCCNNYTPISSQRLNQIKHSSGQNPLCYTTFSSSWWEQIPSTPFWLVCGTTLLPWWKKAQNVSVTDLLRSKLACKAAAAHHEGRGLYADTAKTGIHFAIAVKSLTASGRTLYRQPINLIMTGRQAVSICNQHTVRIQSEKQLKCYEVLHRVKLHTCCDFSLLSLHGRQESFLKGSLLDFWKQTSSCSNTLNM